MFRRLFGLLLASWSLGAWAVIPAAPQFYAQYNAGSWPTRGPFGSWDQACLSVDADVKAAAVGSGYADGRAVVVVSGSQCRGQYLRTPENGGDWFTNASVSVTQGPAVCPANSSAVDGGCQCNSGYQEQGSSCVAVPQCQFGTTVKSGYFDYGKDPAGAPPTLVCAGGCSALFFGDVPAGSALVDGTKHWFAKGSYQMSGGTCDPSADGTAGVPTGTGSIPSDSCGSNQTQGTVTANGKTQTVCVDKVPDDPSKAGQPAPTNEVNESKGSTTTINITNNADGSKTIVTTTINNNGNGTSTKTTTTETKASDGTTTGSTTKTETTGKQTDQQQQQDKCQQNSSAEGCGGNPKDVGGSTLYTAKDKTAASVLTGAKDTIMGSGIGSAMGGFFNVAGGGSCTGIHGTVTVFDRAMSVDSDVFCSSFAANAFLLIRAVILVLAAWWAFRIAVE